MTRWDIIASPFVETSPVTFPQLSPTIRLILNVHEKKEVHVLEFATTCCKSEYIRDGSVGSSREQTRRRGLDTGDLDSHFQEPKANGPERQHHQRVFVFLQTRLSFL